ncbi:MAG: cobalamin biosynthesis protein CobD [Burkholderiaceae bacterium]|nr:cobalamin biosynthesis protein CobD [Burkholderiaceae bacterium]
MSAGLALLLACLIDRLAGEPRNALHPVAWFGRLMGALGRGLPELPPSAALLAGALAWTAGVGGAAALAWGLLQALWQLPAWATVPLLALAIKPGFAWRMLHDEVAAVGLALQQGLEAGRARLSRLCSRDVSRLDAGQVRETAIETLAENFNDSLLAPLFWWLLAGLPGLWAWRAANTLDAMWGYRGRWNHAGRCAARADDLLAWLPARLAAVLLLAVGRSPRGLWQALPVQAARTPSPNGGWPMAAVALRLGLRLGKPGVYTLNPQGRVPQPVDLQHALALGQGAALWAMALAVLLSALVPAGAGLGPGLGLVGLMR